jgi:O-antigen/teichoic acid export membrane protein
MISSKNDPEPESRPAQGAEQSSSLSKAAVGGVAWVGLSYLITRITLLVSTVILARALSPTDFGVYAAALAFITYAEVVNDLGVAQALVILPRDRRRNDAALIVSFGVSGLLVTVAMLTAPMVARFFDQPEIASILRVLSLSLLLRAWGQVPDAILMRDLRFKDRFRANAWRAVIQGLVWIVLAIAGLGVWSLVYGYLAGYAVNSLIMWRFVEYRPGRSFWRVRWSTVQHLLSYAAPLVGSMMLLALINDIDYLIVGRKLGTTALGYYTVAFRVPQMIISNSFLVFSQVLIPVLVRAGRDSARLRRGYVKMVRFQAVYGLSMAVLLVVIAPILVPVLFGARWAPSVVPMQVLSLYAVARSFAMGATDVYKGMGRPQLAFWSSLAWLVALVPALVIATTHGINGVSWAQLVIAGLALVAMHGVAIRGMRLPLRALGRALGPAVLAALATAVGAAAVRAWLPGPAIVRLAVAAIAGVGLGAAMLHVTDRQLIWEIRRLMRPGGDKSQGNNAPEEVEAQT